jgi:hypothetical protein
MHCLYPSIHEREERMTDTTSKSVPTTAIALCTLSGVLVAIQIGVFAQWATAFDAADNQPDRVNYFLAHLPFSLGRLGTTKLTLLSTALGATGLSAALVATRKMVGRRRFLSLGMAIANGLLIVWYGFTLM